jgi:hypothetical protein
MSPKKDAPLTREETIELLEKAMRKPGIRSSTLLKLEAARSKLLGKQPTPSPAPSSKGEPYTYTNYIGETETIPDFWTIGPGGKKWSPEMRRQDRYIEYPEGCTEMYMQSMRDILGKAHRGELTPEQMAKLAAVQAETQKGLEEWRKEHNRQCKAAQVQPSHAMGCDCQRCNPKPGAP